MFKKLKRKIKNFVNKVLIALHLRKPVETGSVDRTS